MGEFNTARGVFQMCRMLANDLKGVRDVNMTMPLMILSHNSFSFAEKQEAFAIARDFIDTGISACEGGDAASAEVICSLFLLFFDSCIYF